MVQVINRPPSIGGLLGELLGGGISGAAEGASSVMQQQLEQFFEEKKQKQQQGLIEKQIQQLTDQGFNPQEARLYALLTTGGQTELAKQVLDRMVRGGQQLPGIGGAPAAVEGEGVQEPVSIDAGTTAAERISREDKRYSTNLPLYQATSKKVEGNETEGIAIQRLETLNESEKLPSGLARWNIKITGDDQGELRFPWLATPETQAFIKTINDFTVKAKDSFGSRVTNFELQRFMKRLPGLLNSQEGRRVVLRQMSIINEMNTLHNQGILDEIEGAGGVRKIDYDQAERRAKHKNKKRIGELKKEYIKLESGIDKLQTKTKALRKVEKGTKVTEDEAFQLLQKAGGDKEKARKLARQLGYEL